MDLNMEKLNKLSLPTTILLASVILGCFYLVAQIVKQKSLEKQQLVEIRATQEAEKQESDRKAINQLSKMSCAEEAEERAINQYKESCTYDCKEGYYYTANYENYYNNCLRRKGLD